MKRFVLFFALAVGLLASVSTLQAQVNMSRYITLTVTSGAAIKLDFAAASAGTPVRIVSGSNTQDITVGTGWYNGNTPSTFTVTAAASTMTIYGNLTGFACSNNGARITALDVSNNTLLTQLYCGSNNLSSLDVLQNTQLAWLYCYSNKLSSLDISKNTQLRGLYCHGNKFTTTALDDIYCALPVRQASDNAIIQPVYDSSSSNHATVLATNKANAIAKNWKVQYYDDDADIPATTGTYTCLQLNMSSYITLTVAKDSAIKLNFKAAAKGTPVRIVSGSTTQNITVGTNWYRGYYQNPFTVTADGNTMTVYGDITSFDCELNYANLTALDVSNNTQLTYLDCGYNNLSSLDVSHNTQLTSLCCRDNQLRSLDVSGCTQLIDLWCYYNRLRSLDVSGCKKLKELKCNDNKLTALDISGCKQLKELSCYKNRLTALDVSNNTKLEMLICYDNKFSSLDVSGCTQLKMLKCYNNKLSSLDLLNNTQLETLECYNNKLSSLDVSGCTQLTVLDCYGNKFTTAALDDIYCSLPDRTGKGKGYILPLRYASDPDSSTVAATNAQNAIDRNWKVRDYSADIATTGTYVCGTVHLDTYITLTVADSAEIRLNFKAAADGTPIKIVSGSRDTTFTVDKDWMTHYMEYKSDGTAMTIYGTITGLKCDHNFINLTAIDVSLNADLRELICFDNKLTSLDLSNNTLLTGLACSDNKLTSLDLSKNTELETLECSYNRSLSSLDLSKNTKLTLLRCNECKLTSLNIKYCKELRILDCSNNELQSLDVSRNKKLWDVRCYKNKFTTQTLDDLYCSLPDRTGTSYGYMAPIYSRWSEDSTLVAATNAQNANDKNWKVEYNSDIIDITTTGTYECPQLNMNRYITLTVDNGGEITLDFKAAAAGTPVRIVSGSNTQDITVDTNWYIGNYPSSFTVTADGTEIKVYGTITGFDCKKNYDDNLTAIDASNNKSLTQLYCSGNRLTALDLSKNTKLTYLYCRGNNLSSLDLSKNTQLIGLDCSYNGLSILDLSKNTQLKRLNCLVNKLSSLDVSGCTQLTILYCYYNKLTALDVSRCTQLDTLSCPYNNVLSSLDVSGCKQLKWLSCEDNELSSLDVSGCTQLKGLECYGNKLTALVVSGCTQLDTLFCFYNKLSSLDVSGCKQLTRLECYENKLTALDVSGCKQLKWLSCYNNKFTTDALDGIYCALPNRTGYENGVIYPIIGSSSTYNDTVLATNKANAIAKNWKVQYYKNDTDITTNGTYDCSTSVAATAAEPALTLYPNPVADVLYLSATARTIRVYNMYGIEVAHATDTDRVEVSHLPAGVYTVRADGMVAKMVKR